MHTYPPLQHRFEVWFTYGGARRWRACAEEEERDEAVAMFNATSGVTDIEVIERENEEN
jgi:hypothetical protein